MGGGVGLDSILQGGVQVSGSKPVGQAAGLQLGGGGAADPGQPQLDPAPMEFVL